MSISLSFKPPLLNVSAGLIYLPEFAKGRHSCTERLSVIPSGLHTLYFSEMSRRTKKLKGRFYGNNSTAFWIQHLYNNVCFAHWSLGYFIQAVLWNWFSEMCCTTVSISRPVIAKGYPYRPTTTGLHTLWPNDDLYLTLTTPCFL